MTFCCNKSKFMSRWLYFLSLNWLLYLFHSCWFAGYLWTRLVLTGVSPVYRCGVLFQSLGVIPFALSGSFSRTDRSGNQSSCGTSHSLLQETEQPKEVVSVIPLCCISDSCGWTLFLSNNFVLHCSVFRSHCFQITFLMSFWELVFPSRKKKKRKVLGNILYPETSLSPVIPELSSHSTVKKQGPFIQARITEC